MPFKVYEDSDIAGLFLLLLSETMGKEVLG